VAQGRTRTGADAVGMVSEALKSMSLDGNPVLAAEGTPLSGLNLYAALRAAL
jgi:hypothetical protein